MTAPEMLKALPGLAKSSLWLHVNALERKGEVRIELTSRGSKDGRKRQVIWHRDAMLT